MNHTIDIDIVTTKLAEAGFEVVQITEYENGPQRIRHVHVEDPYILYFSLIDGEGYYEKGKLNCANVYCGESGDSKYGAWFKSIDGLIRELQKIQTYGEDD